MAIENVILARLEPTIKLDEYKFKAYKEEDGFAGTSKDKGMTVPLVIINGYRFNDWDIKSLEISLEGEIPKIELTITDSRSQFSIDTYPRDGDVISVRMGARSKKVYKDLRIDFDIDSVSSPLRSNLDQGSSNSKYSFSGKMKVPGLFADICKSYGVGTTIDHLEEIATDLKLGLATNVDTSNDSSNLIVAYDSTMDAIGDLVKHSYISDNSFQTYFIDPYYYINFVDINAILNSGDDFIDAHAALTTDFNDSVEDNDSTNNFKSTLMISSHERFKGTNMFISRYSLKNNTGRSVKSHGYMRNIQFFENDSEDNLVSFDITPLTSKKMKDIEAPLRGRYDEKTRFKEEVKYKYVGRRGSGQEAPNTHPNREFAGIHNIQNIKELDKLQLEVELASINHAIHRYQRIPVFIFNETIEQTAGDYNVKLAKDKKGFPTTEKPDIAHETNRLPSALNEFLSGFYVVGKIRYTYKATDGVVKQHLTLLRREWPGRINNMDK